MTRHRGDHLAAILGRLRSRASMRNAGQSTSSPAVGGRPRSRQRPRDRVPAVGNRCRRSEVQSPDTRRYSQVVALHYEIKGDGPSAVFLHPGVADSRVWDPQWISFAGRYRLVRCDLPGFGRSRVESRTLNLGAEVAALLDQLEISAAALIGCSLGGRIALELAVARPDLVSSLVLVGRACRTFSGHSAFATLRRRNSRQ